MVLGLCSYSMRARRWALGIYVVTSREVAIRRLKQSVGAIAGRVFVDRSRKVDDLDKSASIDVGAAP